MHKSKKQISNEVSSPLALGHGVLKQMAMEELPEVKLLESKTAPTSLRWDSRVSPQSFRYLPTQNSLSLTSLYKSMFRGGVYPFRLSTALNMSSSGAGAINSVINIDAVRSSTDFSALSGIFEEFFVVKCHVDYQPVSRYQYPLGGTSTLSVANLPIGVASLQHAAVAYTSASALLNNYAAAWHSTGDPFSFTWKNVESPNTYGIKETDSKNTQGWCDMGTGGGQAYTGQIQIISQSTPPALPFSQVVGTFATHFYLLCRIRE